MMQRNFSKVTNSMEAKVYSEEVNRSLLAPDPDATEGPKAGGLCISATDEMHKQWCEITTAMPEYGYISNTPDYRAYLTKSVRSSKSKKTLIHTTSERKSISASVVE